MNRRRTNAIILGVFALTLLGACGKKAPLRAPEPRAPVEEPASDEEDASATDTE